MLVALRVVRRPRSLLAVTGTILLLLVLAMPHLFTHYAPNSIEPSHILEQPNASHWLGTDETGGDIFTRELYGTRIDMLIVACSVGLAFVIGLPLGLIGGYRAGAVDGLLSGLASGILAIPFILLGFLIIGSFGASVTSLVAVLGFAFAPQVYILVRNEAFSLRGRGYVLSARISGVRVTNILVRHLLRTMAPALVILASQLGAVAIVAEAGLTYLGLGIQPPTVTWGTILLTSKDYYAQAPTYAVVGGVVVAVAAALVLLIGDSIASFVGLNGD